MSINKGEVGRAFRLTTGGYDMSSSTGLTVILTKPDGTKLTKTEASSNPVTAPAIELINDPDVGSQAASTYFEFTSVALDFDQAGTWKACGIYSDASPKIYHTEPSEETFEVGDPCA